MCKPAWVTAIFLFGWLASNGQAQTDDQIDRMRAINRNMPLPIELDQQRIAANGIDVSRSQHLILLSDVRQRDDIQDLGKIFESATRQWCQYFEIPLDKTQDWQMRSMLIADRSRFRKAGLMPNSLPDFLAGFQRGHEMWVYLQPGDYYTRHLLLHEGTHAFMQWFLGGTGAPWYSEGMAELLGIHQWKENVLTLNYQLKDRSEAAYWGRIKLIKEDCRDKKSMSLDDVFAIPGNAYREVRYYAWSWAACQFLSQHPKTREAFGKLPRIASEPPEKFNAKLLQWLADVRPEIDRDWQLFVGEIDFGYEISAGRLRPANNEGSQLVIDSRYSWQSTDIQVKPGDRFAFKAEGQFVVGTENSTPWPCEADGITIDYYRGKPLGTLMVSVLPDNNTESSAPVLHAPHAIGFQSVVTFEHRGRLAFRINESPSKMSDNRGSLTIKFKKMKP